MEALGFSQSAVCGGGDLDRLPGVLEVIGPGYVLVAIPEMLDRSDVLGLQL
jgi:hypothetical protein